jgi:hypothetical protein
LNSARVMVKLASLLFSVVKRNNLLGPGEESGGWGSSCNFFLPRTVGFSRFCELEHCPSGTSAPLAPGRAFSGAELLENFFRAIAT